MWVPCSTLSPKSCTCMPYRRHASSIKLVFGLALICGEAGLKGVKQKGRAKGKATRLGKGKGNKAENSQCWAVVI